MRFILLSFTVLSLAACGGDKKEKPTANAAPRSNELKVDAYIVHTESFAESIEVPGTVVSNEMTDVHPEVSGRITYLNVRDGQYVRKGDLLAKLNDEDLQAQLKKIQIQLSIAEKTEERQAQLLKIQGISQQDYDLSLLQVNSLKADIDIIRTSIEKTQIRAPFSGKLSLKDISPGAYVTPASVITRIIQSDVLKLDFSVPEKYAGAVKTGQLVTFSYEGSDATHSAKVVATEPNVSENTRSLIARAVVQSKTSNLLPGAFAKVKLDFAPSNNAILVPTQAVIPQARGKQVIVIKNGKAQFTDVTTGVRDASRVQITEGLSKGDTVVVTGLLSIRPEAKLSVNKIVTETDATKAPVDTDSIPQ